MFHPRRYIRNVLTWKSGLYASDLLNALSYPQFIQWFATRVGWNSIIAVHGALGMNSLFLFHIILAL